MKSRQRKSACTAATVASANAKTSYEYYTTAAVKRQVPDFEVLDGGCQGVRPRMVGIGFTLLLKLLLIQQFRAALFIKIHPQAAGRFIIGTAMRTQIAFAVIISPAAGLAFDVGHSLLLSRCFQLSGTHYVILCGICPANSSCATLFL